MALVNGCKHPVLLRLDGRGRPISKRTPVNQIAPHFECEECGDVFYAAISNKPILVEQVAKS